MSLATDVQTHAPAIASAVATDISARITAYPKRYAKDELDRKLAKDIHDAINKATGDEDFADLGQ